MAKIFDTHAHYDDEAFDTDRDQLLNQLVTEENVGCIVNIGCNMKTTENTVELTRLYPFIYGAAGVHPDDAKELDQEKFCRLKEIAQTEDKIVAIGEIGLDYHWDNSPRDIQKYWFEQQMELARELNLPVVIHSRDAAKDTLEMIRSAGGKDRKFNMHCFSYSVELAREYLNMGHYLGIGGVVTFKNAKKLKEVVAYMPADRILLETDSPYLTPVPYRGKRNHSGHIRYVAEEIARIKEMETEQVLDICWENAEKFYGIQVEK